MEKRDLYDVNRKFTGKTFYKGDPIPENLYYVKMNINLNDINFNEEVSDVKLVTVEEIKQMIENKEFHISHVKPFSDILELIKR